VVVVVSNNVVAGRADSNASWAIEHRCSSDSIQITCSSTASQSRHHACCADKSNPVVVGVSNYDVALAADRDSIGIQERGGRPNSVSNANNARAGQSLSQTCMYDEYLSKMNAEMSFLKVPAEFIVLILWLFVSATTTKLKILKATQLGELNAARPPIPSEKVEDPVPAKDRTTTKKIKTQKFIDK
jgi:hypothetical protein